MPGTISLPHPASIRSPIHTAITWRASSPSAWISSTTPLHPSKKGPEEIGTDTTGASGCILLSAAHAHLGHTSEATAARTELEAIEGGQTDRVSSDARVPFKQPADIERLWKGLSKAGVPYFPFGLEAKNRLTGEEIRSLVFGHELRPPSRPRRAVCTHDDDRRAANVSSARHSWPASAGSKGFHLHLVGHRSRSHVRRHLPQSGWDAGEAERIRLCAPIQPPGVLAREVRWRWQVAGHRTQAAAVMIVGRSVGAYIIGMIKAGLVATGMQGFWVPLDHGPARAPRAAQADLPLRQPPRAPAGAAGAGASLPARPAVLPRPRTRWRCRRGADPRPATAAPAGCSASAGAAGTDSAAPP